MSSRGNAHSSYSGGARVRPALCSSRSGINAFSGNLKSRRCTMVTKSRNNSALANDSPIHDLLPGR